MDAFIFDMDGVIVDSELHWKSLEGFFLKALVPTWTSADQDRIIGLSVHDLYRVLSTEYGLTGTKEEFLERYHAMTYRATGTHVHWRGPCPSKACARMIISRAATNQVRKLLQGTP